VSDAKPIDLTNDDNYTSKLDFCQDKATLFTWVSNALQLKTSEVSGSVSAGKVTLIVWLGCWRNRV